MFTRHASLLAGLTVAAGFIVAAAAPADAAIIWKSNGMENTAWFGSQSDEQAHGGIYSAKITTDALTEVVPYNNPSWALPAVTNDFESFVVTAWLYAADSGQTAKAMARFYNGSGESNYSQSSETTLAANTWTKLTWDITGIVNQRVSEGYTHLSRLGFDRTSTGGTYYVDDVSIQYSVIPEPASLALMGLGGLVMLSRRRSAGNDD